MGRRLQAKIYDAKVGEVKRYQEGDLVMVRITSDNATETSHKLKSKYKEPFKVLRVLYNDRYLIENLRGAEKNTDSDACRSYKGVDYDKKYR